MIGISQAAEALLNASLPVDQITLSRSHKVLTTARIAATCTASGADWKIPSPPCSWPWMLFCAIQGDTLCWSGQRSPGMSTSK